MVIIIPRLMPGDPLAYSAEGGEVMISLKEDDIQKFREYYGLDKPVFEQFKKTVENNLSGYFGQSIFYKQSVAKLIGERLPWTLYIMLFSLSSSLILGVILALICSKNKKSDSFIFSIMSILGEIPAFIIGILLLFLIGANVSFLPLSGGITPFKDFYSIWDLITDIFLHSLLPLTAMIIITTPNFFFTARSSFQTVLNKQYIETAKSKGLSSNRIRYKYILLNSIFPIIACFFMSVGTTVGGALLIENVFAYPGLGRLLKEAVHYRDYALIQGVFLLSTFIVLCSSFVADIINSKLNKG